MKTGQLVPNKFLASSHLGRNGYRFHVKDLDALLEPMNTNLKEAFAQDDDFLMKIYRGLSS